MIRKALVCAAIVVSVVLGASAAFAQYQPGQPGLVLVPSTTLPNGSVSAIGFGCAKLTTVTLTIRDTVVGTTTSGPDSRGSFTITFTAPDTPGQYVVIAKCKGAGGGEIQVSSVLTVIAAPTTTLAPEVPGLPQTGSSDTLPLLRIGLVLIAGGGLLVLAVRRQRES